MKFISTVLAALTLSGAAVQAHPFDLPFEMTEEHHEFFERSLEERQSNNLVAIKGVPQTAVHPRLEIRTLSHSNPNQFALFILAMQKFEAQAATKKTGYYQVAGIHGVPRVSWNGVDQCSSCGGTDGYCTHASVLFPAWHRAYMALFEQELFAMAKQIANSYQTNGVNGGPTKAQMQKAASTLRMPYWDWASIPPAGQHNLPGTISGNIITVNTPTGSKTIQNPLYRYVFKQNPSNLVYSPFTGWDFTRRYPTNDSSNAVSNPAACVTAFDQIQGSLQDQIYQLMTTCTDYSHFSNVAATGSTSCSNSLEGIHNLVHQTAGGPGTNAVPQGGHMTYLSLAAFDPIFWIHHANVDRLFAMWQTLHDSYGASQTQVQATWAYPSGSVQGASSPLKPFRSNKNGGFWTTNSVKDWAKTFHYTYPEFQSGGSRSQIAAAVNRLYGPSATTPSANSKRTAMPAEDAQDAQSTASTQTASSAQSTVTSATSTATSAQSSGSSAQTTGTSTTNTKIHSSATSVASSSASPSSGITTPFTANNGSTFQYVANIVTPQNALSGSYTIYLFHGQPTETDPTQYIFDANLISPVAVLSMGSQHNGTMGDVMIESSVPLTRTLQSAVTNGTLADLTEMSVASYLRKALVWKIAGPTGANVDPATIEGFKIGVYASSSGPLDTIFELPTWSPFFLLEDITSGRPGGLGSLADSVASAADAVISVTHVSTTYVCEATCA